MKSKKIPLRKLVIALVVLLLVITGGMVAYSLTSYHTTTPIKVSQSATFTFDTTKAPDWFAGANIDGDTINASAAPTSKKLATTTRIIAQGTAEQPTGNCFVQYSYWSNNSKDPDQAVSELAANGDSTTSGSFVLQPTNTVALSMATPSGNTPFKLHQYTVTGPDASQMSDGEEFAALKAGTGYIDIRGYCKTADELSITLPVISAVGFKLIK